MTGTYQIDVFPFDKEPKPGRYTIKLNEVLSAEASKLTLAGFSTS